jgi:hypothetical protein
MAFGNIGKALVGQAIETTKKNMMDGLMSADSSKPAEKHPAAPGPAEPIGGVILGQIQGMQRALREDQELLVYCDAGGEKLRVTDIFVPNLQVLVLAGEDAEKNITRLVTPADSVQLVCKIMKVAPGAQPVRINVRSPRAKAEGGA